MNQVLAEHLSREEATEAHVALSRRLRNWRKDCDLPLKSIAFDLGVSISTVSAWENGTRFPSGHHLDQLAHLMGMPVCALLYHAEGSCPYNDT